MYSIPIIVNNFNRLTTTKKLADDLSKLGYTNIHILDNNSTYPPLLEWYKDCPYTVKRLDSNMLWLAVYNSGYINEWLGKEPWVVYTDSDIELNPLTPSNFIQTLIQKTEKYGKSKGGLALKVDDLPDNDYANHYRWWEQRYWQRQLEPDVYEADIDTTFCIIRPGGCFDYNAIRVAGDMIARHIPWYTDFSNLSDEEKYYLETSDGWSTYKRYYYSKIKEQV